MDLYFCMRFFRALTRMFMMKDSRYAVIYVFVRYALIRWRRLLRMKINWLTIADDDLKNIVEKLSNEQNDYFDRYSCVAGNVGFFKIQKPTWFFVCTKVSSRKYKILIVPVNDINDDTILISETMRYNLENALASTFDTFFLLPIKNNTVDFAVEAKISLICNPNDSPYHVMDGMLKSYFSEPRFLRENDIFRIDPKDHMPDLLYSSGNPLMSVIYFKVNTIEVNDDEDNTNYYGSYILFEETALIQEPNVHSYLPCVYSCHDQTKEQFMDKYPPNFKEPLKHLESCILPFIKNDIRLPVKPVFLVKGSEGSGKRTLIRIASEKMGLNLLNADFAEVQALSAAQTEAKLRIVLHNAKQSVPCILCLNNIEVFGKNSEGQKDERIISTFSTEINALYAQNLEYPLVIAATSNDSELSPELHRIFIETIHVDHLDQKKRTDFISWLLGKRRINHQVDLSKVAGMCSDFRYSDLIALVLHAVKSQCRRSLKSPILMQEDFDKAYEYMQSIYTDCKGAPRVPKVHWEDIGGLVDLKHEIIRRIQLPLLNAFGFGQSGILLYGPPGTGKTLLAKAVATEYQLHFLSVKGPEVLNMYVGQSEKNIRQVFERARAAAPCIIFFDELDSLAPNRGRSGDSGGVMDRVVSQLLAEMDGLESSSSIFIIGATNRPDLIDPALLRPGRFDKLLYVGIHSDRSSQLSVLKALTRKFNLRENGKELEDLLDKLPDHTTGADLYSVCSDAWLNATRKILIKHNERDESKDKSRNESLSKDIDLNGPVVVELEDFLEAANGLVSSVSEEEAERYRRMQMELSSVA